jgi:hypothetical protein
MRGVGVPRGRRRGHRHPPRRGERARGVGTDRRTPARSRGRGVHIRAVGRHLPRRAVAAGGARAAAARGGPRSVTELLAREPAAGAVALALQEAAGGAVVPAYKRN